MHDKIGERTRNLIRQICKNSEIEMIVDYISNDRVCLLVLVLPHMPVSKTIQYIKECVIKSF
ncbi:transposase [Clostridium ljungdahlii]|uniref:transposase n=1 Tax=Clostridium ljungdahlii TaxID=1538 RepID=UPI0009EE7B0A|nr:transposase [Clostridium ljungdahlii]